MKQEGLNYPQSLSLADLVEITRGCGNMSHSTYWLHVHVHTSFHYRTNNSASRCLKYNPTAQIIQTLVIYPAIAMLPLIEFRTFDLRHLEIHLFCPKRPFISAYCFFPNQRSRASWVWLPAPLRIIPFENDYRLNFRTISLARPAQCNRQIVVF